MSQDFESLPETANHRGEIDVLAQNVEHISDLHSEMTDATLIVCKAIVLGENVENVLEEDSDDSDIFLLSGSADLLVNDMSNEGEVPSVIFHNYVVSFSVFSISIYFDDLQCGIWPHTPFDDLHPPPHLLLTFPMPSTTSSSSIATRTQSQKCKEPGGCCAAGTKR